MKTSITFLLTAVEKGNLFLLRYHLHNIFKLQV